MGRRAHIASLVVAFLLGVAAAVLAFLGVGRLGDPPGSTLATVGVVVALVLVAAGLFGLSSLSRERRQAPKRTPPSQLSRADVELPTLAEFYSNTPDGRLHPPILARYRDLDPASDPTLAPRSEDTPG